MNYKQARIFFFSLIVIVCLLIAGTIFRGCKRSDAPAIEEAAVEPPAEIEALIDSVEESEPLKTASHLRDLGKEFDDLNADHLVFAQKLGLKPIGQTRDIMAQTKPIVKVVTNDNVKIDRLTHSYPYLVPSAAKLLNDIGEEFNRKLAEQDGGDYKIIATSLLRTSESVKRLKRGNVNSTENSAHLYGTTFDISYVRFDERPFNMRKHSDGELKLILAEVLKEMKQQGRCLVKFERKQGCFHITATGR